MAKTQREYVNDEMAQIEKLLTDIRKHARKTAQRQIKSGHWYTDLSAVRQALTEAAHYSGVEGK